ncbi:MAG: type I 3-dehydroquinate dehydratase [Myxococcales bacterium]|jgi:3-dehydroquinate dehydratase type I|nr:type I 3-dehydroquinate dehydratase [Myxococcales bacterium]
MRLCVSVGVGPIAEVIARLRGLGFAEVRLDLIDFGSDAPSFDDLSRLFGATGTRTVATCRPGRFSESTRVDLLTWAIRASADFVDLELDAPEALLRHVTQALREGECAGGRLILSHHHLQNAPSESELWRLLASGRARGADLIKIACPVHDSRDAARLLALQDLSEWRGRIVLAGLGQLAGLFRCLALLKGAAFTYAAPDSGPKVLDDQPRATDLWRAFERLERALQERWICDTSYRY